MSKVHVKGELCHPVFRFLRAQEEIQWNFTKFAVNRRATEFIRYEARTVNMEGDILRFLGD